MCVAIGVTDDNYGYIQTKGSGITTPGNLVLLPGGGNLYKGNINNVIWHAGNDGSGSGLDADLLDGKHASAFATIDHNHDDRYAYSKVIYYYTNSGGFEQTIPFWFKFCTLPNRNAGGEFYTLIIEATNGGDAPQITTIDIARSYNNDSPYRGWNF